MTVYATQQDIIDRESLEFVETIAWDTDTQGIDTKAVERALQDASDEINARLVKRYRLPLSSVPSLLNRICVTIAIYYLMGEAEVSEIRKTRFTESMNLLKSIAKGEADLGLPDDLKADTNSAGSVQITGPERVITRKSMGGVI